MMGERPVEIPAEMFTKYKALPGRVVVIADSERTEQGGIIIPQGQGALNTAGRLRPDIGTVIAVGDGVTLNPGDRVAIRPYDGQWNDWNGHKDALRFYGIGRSADYLESERIPWHESIPAVFVDSVMFPTHDGVLVRRDRDWPEGLACPDNVRQWKDSGTVVRAGELSRYEPGDLVFFSAHMEDAFLNIEYGQDDGLWLIPGASVVELCLTS